MPNPINPDSPLGAVLGPRPGPEVPMQWSLGVLGDLMWTRLPETRPLLAELLFAHIEAAVHNGRELTPVRAGEMVFDALYYPVLEPALDAYPAGRDRLAELLSVVFDAHQADGPDQDMIRYSLEIYVFHYLTEPGYREIVAEVHPQLAALALRSRPS